MIVVISSLGAVPATTLVVALVSLCGAITPRPAESQTPPWIALSGPKDHGLPLHRLTGDAEIRTPIVFALDDRPTQVTVTSVRLVERSEDRPREAFDFRVAGNDLIAKVRLDSLPDAGTYAVTVLARSESTRREQRLDLTYVRGSVSLSSPWPAIRLETSSDAGSALRPATWPISAPAGRAITFPQREVMAYLRGPDDKPLAARLRVTLPRELPPGGQGEAGLSLVGDLPRGTSAGSLIINSPQLREPLTVPVEIVSRASGLMLFLLLAGGILAGWGLRWWLTNRQAQVKAEAEAHEEYGRLRDLATKEADPDLRARLLAALTPLEGSLGRRESATKLQSIVVAATTSTTEELRKADARRKELGDTLKDLAEKTGFAGDYPTPVNQLVTGIQDRAARARRDLGSGLITDVENAIASLMTKLNDEVRDAARAWLDALIELERCGKWPATRFETLRLAAIGAAEKGAPSVTSEVFELLALVRNAAGILHEIQGKGVRGLKGLADECLRILKPVASAGSKHTSAVRAAADALPGSESDDSGKAIEAMVAAISRLREALGEMIRAGIPSPDQRGAEVEKALLAGQFNEAATIVVEANKVSPPVNKAAPPLFAGRTPVVRVPASTTDFDSSPARTHGWRIWIVSPARLVVGEPAVLSIGSSQPVSAHAVFVWRIPGQPAVQTPGGSPVCQMVPRAEGPLHVVVEGFDPAGGERTATTEVLSVRPAIGYVASEILKKEWGVLDTVGRIASGLLIAAAGYFIFRATFVGDLASNFSVFLWGFSTDIGLAKVAELAKPLTGLQLPTRAT